ncbi:hypothetical protein ACI2L1_42045 [Streptomyces sp. NPDC019531]
MAEGREAAAVLGVKELDVLRLPAKDVKKHSTVGELSLAPQKYEKGT